MQMPVPVLIFPRLSPWSWTIKALQSLTLRWLLDPPKGDYYLRSLEMCDMWIKVVAREQEKEDAQAILDQIRQQEWDEQATQRKEKECKLWRVCQCEARHKMVKEGAWWQEEYNCKQRASGACPQSHGMVWIWVVQKGQVQKSWMGWGSMECQPHGPPAIGHKGWSAHGALLRLTSRPSKVFTFAHLHPTS